MPSWLKINSFLQTRDKLQAAKAHVRTGDHSHAFFFCSQILLLPLLFCGQPWHHHHTDLTQIEVLFRIQWHFHYRRCNLPAISKMVLHWYFLTILLTISTFLSRQFVEKCLNAQYQPKFPRLNQENHSELLRAFHAFLMHFCLRFKQNLMHMYCTYKPSKKPYVLHLQAIQKTMYHTYNA